jgi:phosphoglucosamine mutase
LKDKPTIIIGCDTRLSNTYLTLGVASGAMSGGAKVIDVGIVPTAGIAYLTKDLNADYGIVISASHNSGEYNGIKVFNAEGYKLSDKEETAVERCFIKQKINSFPNIGTYEQNFNLIKIYRDYLIATSENSLKGKTIVLDCAYGASHKVAPEVFTQSIIMIKELYDPKAKDYLTPFGRKVLDSMLSDKLPGTFYVNIIEERADTTGLVTSHKCYKY